MRKKPMLAQNVGDYSRIKSDDWPLYIQPKLDGVRCLIQYDKVDVLDYPIPNGYTELDGIRYQVNAYSRTGKLWKI